MELELLDYSIDELQWGERTILAGNSLSVSSADFRELLKDLCQGIHVDYELARPGESKRIVHVLDTVLPIAKLSGPDTTFPGFGAVAQLLRFIKYSDSSWNSC
jgi:sarcosine reductase